MGFRFRRSIRIGKGLRLNLSKSGVSLSAGGRGASFNIGPRGTSSTVGIPGTGLSYRSSSSGTRSRSKGVSAASSASSADSLGCLGAALLLLGGILLITTKAYVWALILLGAGGVLVYVQQRAAKELAALRAAEALEERERREQAEEQRRADLTARFGAETCARIMTGQMWVGQTEEQLREALGKPLDVDEKVMKTKTRRIWKYDQTGANRFRTRVILENGLVTGWERK